MANRSKRHHKSSPPQPLRSTESSDIEQPATDIDSATTPGNTQPPKSQDLTDEQELSESLL
ncbi:hypothetical protein MJO29_004992 [Puccinia striiformis f. sp. tritici]|nr:hypothetical protein MJO29_004992 [Puccinia striiformis f. sp. tritici]